MNPILLAAFHGFVKGYALAETTQPHPDKLKSVVLGPLQEELAFRGPLKHVAPGLGDLASAAAFAAAHYEPGAAPGFRKFKVADAMVGGLLYAKAFRSYGLAGAVVAHALHNLMVGFGQAAGPKPVPAHRRRR